MGGVPSVFVANVMSAIGAIRAIRARGLRVPRDISVVGFHDVRLAGYLDPPPTTVRKPLPELGARAVDELLAGGGGPATVFQRHAARAGRAGIDCSAVRRLNRAGEFLRRA